jgi:hypothetical protein
LRESLAFEATLHEDRRMQIFQIILIAESAVVFHFEVINISNFHILIISISDSLI